MIKPVDVVVVGGGMVGCLSAYYLSEAGISVAIVECTGVGVKASGNSAGGLNPLHGPGIPGPMSELAMTSFTLHLALWDSLQHEGATGFFPRQVKRMFLAFDQAGLAAFEGARQLYTRSKGFSAHLLDAEAVKKLEHRVNPAVYGALYTEGNAAIEALAYNRAIADAALRRGAQLVDAAATGLVCDSGRVSGVVTDKGIISCGQVVITTGAWGEEPSRWLGVSIPVEPLKGEMLLVDIPGAPLDYDISYNNFSLFCRGQNQVWIGATETSEGYDERPTDRAYQALLARGVQIMPTLAEAKVLEHTVGLRPVTPDGLPIVGKVPGYENVYLSTGAGKKGTLISAGMGKAIADLITQGQTAISIEAADPSRFFGVVADPRALRNR